MKLHVRLFALTGPPTTVTHVTVGTRAEAESICRQHAEIAGFSRVKFVDDDEDDYTTRATATTPNGRAGRNIGTIEPDEDFS